jgi:hypothetical protein
MTNDPRSELKKDTHKVNFCAFIYRRPQTRIQLSNEAVTRRGNIPPFYIAAKIVHQHCRIFFIYENKHLWLDYNMYFDKFLALHEFSDPENM